MEADVPSALISTLRDSLNRSGTPFPVGNSTDLGSTSSSTWKPWDRDGEYDVSIHLHLLEPYLGTDWLIADGRPLHLRDNGWIYIRSGENQIVARVRISGFEHRDSRPERTGEDAGDRGPGDVFIVDPSSWETVNYRMPDSVQGRKYRYLTTAPDGGLQHFKTTDTPHVKMGPLLLPVGANEGYGTALVVVPTTQPPSPRTGPRTGVKRDYEKEARQNRRTGEDGEGFVVRHEKQRLNDLGRPELADQVKWAAKLDGDGLGYDVLSFNAETGEELYIEVKATHGGEEEPFFLTQNELSLSQEKPDQFALYRVFDLSKTEVPRLYIIRGDVSASVHLREETYRCWPNGAKRQTS